MPFKLELGDNPALVILCGILVLLAITFFLALFIADSLEKRRIAKKKHRFSSAAAQPKKREHPRH